MYKRSKPLHYHVVCSHKLFLLFNYSIKIANRVRNFVFSDKSSTQSIFYYTTTGFSHSFKPSPWIEFGHVIKKLENNNILRNVPLFPNQFRLVTMVSQTPILVTYKGIHAQMRKREWGPGGSAPRKSFHSHALQIAGKYLFSFVIYSRPFRKLTATQKYNVCLKVIGGYFKSKMPLQEYKRQHKG